MGRRKYIGGLHALGLLILLLPAAGANAQERFRRFEVVTSVGGSFFDDQVSQGTRFFLNLDNDQLVILPSRDRESVTSAARFVFGLRWWLNESDAFEASYSVGPNDVNVHQTVTFAPFDLGDNTFPADPLAEARFKVPSSMHFLSANYVRYLPRIRTWRPFLTGGAGVMFLDEFFVHKGFAMNFGGGIDRPLNDYLSFRAEYRVFAFRQPKVSNFLFEQSGFGYHHGPSVGLAFRF